VVPDKFGKCRLQSRWHAHGRSILWVFGVDILPLANSSFGRILGVILIFVKKLLM